MDFHFIPRQKMNTTREEIGEELMSVSTSNKFDCKKHILIYAHYYWPDVASTGQILTELAEGMLSRFWITVICVVPSYSGHIDEQYKTKPFYKETHNRVNIIRVRVPEFTKANKLSRIKNIISYYYAAKKATKLVHNVDYVFTISQPPILGGMLGVFGKKKLSAKLIYNIQDLNPEQIKAVDYSSNKPLLELLQKLDERTCEKSDLIITVGRDLVKTVNKRFKGRKIPKTVLINNWIDEKNIYPLPADNEKVMAFKTVYNLKDKFVIMYSGNIGLYYDLENIIKIIEKFPAGTKTSDGREVVFAFVGSGSRLPMLQEYVREHGMRNVEFIPYQPKEDLVYSLNAADVHWCVNAKGIKGISCPSKVYGIMAAGKPMIGVLEAGSEIRCLIEESGCGKCCEPGDYEGINNILRNILTYDNRTLIEVGMKGRLFLEANLTKEKSIQKYITTISKV